ncbi:MAG TPA: hypothetical protein VHV99_00455 [Paraburkholderia sp.]|jgi:hypothetical protein|nr:hypothetical protein [Paraburkholderia sp.]
MTDREKQKRHRRLILALAGKFYVYPANDAWSTAAPDAACM